MFKKLFHSALWGLAAAGVILFAVPKLNNSSLFSADDIVSFNSAVRIASPAVGERVQPIFFFCQH